MTRSEPAELRVGRWQVVPARGLLTSGNREERLEPRLMELLLLFASAPGRVIGRDEIVARVWSGRTVGDDTIASAISRLRSAMGDSKGERYIETLSKRGYRLVAAVSESGKSLAAPRIDSDAANLVRLGLAALSAMLPPSLAQARLYFEGAIRADANRADAQAGLAETLLVQIMMGQGEASALVTGAKAAARASVALDPSFAPGWAILGLAMLLADRDFAAADEALQHAIGLDPALASAHRNRCFALACVGRFSDAEREARRAAELEPYSLSARNDLLQILLAARRFRHAIAEAARTLSLSQASFQAWSAKGWAHIFLGEEEEGRAALIESLKTMGTNAETIEALALGVKTASFEKFCSVGADLFETQKVLFAPRPLDIAMLRVQAGEFDAAFAALDQAVARGDPVLLLLPYLPHLDRVRNDLRFAKLMERVRLVR